MSDDHLELPLHLIGTQAFLPALLTYICNVANPTSPSQVPLDHVIFQSILLCLIAGDKNLILRTPEEDVGLAVKLAVWTLSSIFNLPTHKLKIRNRTSFRSQSQSKPDGSSWTANADVVQSFLRSLFLPSGSTSSCSNQASQDEGSTENVRPGSGHHRHHSTSRSGPSKHKYARSRSFPSNLATHAHAQSPGQNQSGNYASTQTLSVSPDFLLVQTGVPHSELSPIPSTSASSSVLKSQPLYAYPHDTTSMSTSPSPRLPHSFTDPFPLPTAGRRRVSGDGSLRSKAKSKSEKFKRPLQLPQALVLSGLENASEATQRAFATVLGDRKVVLDSKKGKEKGKRGEKEGETKEEEEDQELEDGEWDLPEGFIAVYVCPWSARERPAIHKSLLDKFAMSTNLFIPQNIRNEFRLLPFAPFSPAAAGGSASSSVGTGAGANGSPPRAFHGSYFFSHSNPASPSPAHPVSLPPTHTPPVRPTPLPALYGAHLRPPSGSCSSSSTAFPPASASASGAGPAYLSPITDFPPLPAPALPPALLSALQDACAHRTHVSPGLGLYLADIFSAARQHPRLDGMRLTARAVRDAEALVRASRVVGTDLTGMEVVRPPLGVGGGGSTRRGRGTEEESSATEDKDERSGAEEEQEEGEEEYELLESVQRDDASASLSASKSTRTQAQTRMFDVSEVDIARIVPRVISHRVRLRDGPEDEVLASALFGATFRPPEPNASGGGGGVPDGAPVDLEDRTGSVKGVLVQILSEV